MNNDDNRNNSENSTSENAFGQGMRVLAWVIGTLLKVAGILAILGGLLQIALSNMDGNPWPDLFWGTVTTIVGLVMLYAGFKIAKRARRK